MLQHRLNSATGHNPIISNSRECPFPWHYDPYSEQLNHCYNISHQNHAIVNEHLFTGEQVHRSRIEGGHLSPLTCPDNTSYLSLSMKTQESKQMMLWHSQHPYYRHHSNFLHFSKYYKQRPQIEPNRQGHLLMNIENRWQLTEHYPEHYRKDSIMPESLLQWPSLNEAKPHIPMQDEPHFYQEPEESAAVVNHQHGLMSPSGSPRFRQDQRQSCSGLFQSRKESTAVFSHGLVAGEVVALGPKSSDRYTRYPIEQNKKDVQSKPQSAQFLEERAEAGNHSIASKVSKSGITFPLTSGHAEKERFKAGLGVRSKSSRRDMPEFKSTASVIRSTSSIDGKRKSQKTRLFGLNYSDAEHLKLSKRSGKKLVSDRVNKCSSAVLFKEQYIQNKKQGNEMCKDDDCPRKALQLVELDPRFRKKTMLEYLCTDWEDEEKNVLPNTLEPLCDDLDLAQKLFRLRYILHYWQVGPETKFDDTYVRRALLCFSGDELKQGISWHSEWGGLTDVLRATIALCKGNTYKVDYKLWVEHDVMKMADILSTNDRLGVNFGDLDNDLTYDEVSENVRLELLKLVDCEVEQKKSWWEKGSHLAYIYFTWPEGLNMGNYHVIFDVNTGFVLHKWQYRFRSGTWEEFSGSKGRLLYAGGYKKSNKEYEYEREILKAASKELVNLRAEVLEVLRSSLLYSVAFIVVDYWGFDLPQQVYRSLDKDLKKL